MFSFRHGLRSLVLLVVAALGLFATGIGHLAAAPPQADLPWKYDLTRGLEEARKASKRLLVDFTGVNCIPCKTNEQNVFPLPEVRTRLARLVLVKLYTDQIPNSFYTPEVLKKFDGDTEQQEKDAEPNRTWMGKFGGQGVPLYVVVAPTAGGYKEVARFDKGLVTDKKPGAGVKDFLDFLDRGLAEAAGPSQPIESRGNLPATAKLIDFDVKAEPATARRGQIVKLLIKGKPHAGFHTYPVTMRSSQQEDPQLSALRIPVSKDFKPLWPIKESEPEFVPDWGKVLLEHKKPFTWEQNILVGPEATPGKHSLTFSIKLQVCDDSHCTWGTHTFSVPITVKDEAALPVPDSITSGAASAKPPILVKPVPGGLSGSSSGEESGGLLAFVLQGVFWGGVSLLTPCVFPMIPITVSFFLKQSEKEHHRPILMALVYSGTIVVVLTIAAVALLSFFRNLSTYWLMNFGLGALFVFFALSLFGMYEIELPSGLARFTSSREGSGLAGTVFMALTFTIISFACVAPFLGGFGGTAANAKLSFSKILLGGLAFSMTFASPFLLLALFPAMLKKLPRSGTWLNSVKVVMGFLELAAALKFFRQGELLITSETQFFTYDFVLALYVGISVLCGLYLLCVYRLPHDTPLENLGVPRLLFGLAFLGLAAYLLPATWKNDKGQSQRPKGVVFAWIDSFLLPEDEADLPWTGDLNDALKTAAKSPGKRIFIDFTGKTCTNCKINEKEVFPKREVRELMQQYLLVQLFTDRVPDRLYPGKERQKLSGTNRPIEDAEKNLAFQRKRFNTAQLPLYAIGEPDGKGGFREVDRYSEGKINNVDEFVDFLRRNLGAVEK